MGRGEDQWSELQVGPDEAAGQRGHEEEQGHREHGERAGARDAAALHRGDLRRVQ